MTQIITVITQDYALLASDRLLTYGEGPRVGEAFDDDTCKLVSLCNVCGIGYSGLAVLGGTPTHEWIATTLAAANCRDAATASKVLMEATPSALPTVRAALRHQIFLLSGWAYFGDPPTLRSHFCVVTNSFDEAGQVLATPRQEFHHRVRALRNNEAFLWHAIGQPLGPDRVPVFERNLRRLVARDIGPKECLRLLVAEILHTHQGNEPPTVGEKILAFCIPKKAVELQLRTGDSSALAQLPDENATAFTYFDPVYSELVQYGPTFVCGEFAATDVQTETDPARDFQSSEMRYLSLPKRKT